jgi:ribosomal protein S18 acetylase RimI-like enzyme
MIRVVRSEVDDAETTSAALAPLYHRQPADIARMQRMLSDPTSVVLLAKSGDEAVGYLHGQLINQLDGTVMLLVYDVAVVPSRRREGIGTQLMEATFDLGRELGASRCWLVTEPDNAASRGLYESLDGADWSAVGFGWNLV